MTDIDKVLDALKRPYCHMVIDINKITNISNTKIRKILDDLVADGSVAIINKNYYLQKKGIIEIKDKGYGFIKVEGEDEEYYVERDMNSGAYTGDEVLFYILPKTRGQKKDTAVVIKILKHSNDFIYGLLIEKKNKYGVKNQIISYNKDFDIKATVLKEDLNGAVDGSIVVGELYDFETDPKARIIKIVGHKDDPGVDISLIALEYGFDLTFPDEALKEASELPLQVDASKYPSRRDFRDDKVITIDGDDSKDFDDAVCVKKLSNGNYKLYVHIADVSEYVHSGSALDLEALKRGTSVYLADRVIPMLPHSLSNGICSLNEGVDRLVLSCIMEIDNTGNLVNYDICEGIINSAHRMTYNKVNKILSGDSSLIDEYIDIYPMICDMKELSEIIRAKRVKNGALDFDVPEYKISMNDRGEPIKFELRERFEAELLIEDFMLMANQTVAYHMYEAEIPCMYRVHEAPVEEKVMGVFGFIQSLGYKVKISRNGILPSQIQSIMSEVKEEGVNYYIINQLMLRAMMKAKYEEECIGHYGLALDYYCHFTSPIRRYPDLFVHRSLKTLLLHPKKSYDKDLMELSYQVHDYALRSSEQEKKSVDCEREVNDMLMAVYMQRHMGEAYDGVINSITQFGMFITIDGGIEGLCHINNMSGYFVYDDKKMTLSNYKMSYRVGDRVRVVCVSASKKDRSIDFMLESDLKYKEDDYYGYRYNRN